jgi:hypothetical protein
VQNKNVRPLFILHPPNEFAPRIRAAAVKLLPMLRLDARPALRTSCK